MHSFWNLIGIIHCFENRVSVRNRVNRGQFTVLKTAYLRGTAAYTEDHSHQKKPRNCEERVDRGIPVLQIIGRTYQMKDYDNYTILNMNGTVI